MRFGMRMRAGPTGHEAPLYTSKGSELLVGDSKKLKEEYYGKYHLHGKSIRPSCTWERIYTQVPTVVDLLVDNFPILVSDSAKKRA